MQNQIEKEMLKKTFPWLTNLEKELELSIKNIDRIDIQEFNEALLSQTGWEDSYWSSCGSYRNYCNYFLVSQKDDNYNVLKFSNSGHSGDGCNRIPDSDWESDPIGIQLQNYNSPEKNLNIIAIVCCTKSGDDINEPDVEREWLIYLFDPKTAKTVARNNLKTAYENMLAFLA